MATRRERVLREEIIELEHGYWLKRRRLWKHQQIQIAAYGIFEAAILILRYAGLYEHNVTCALFAIVFVIAVIHSWWVSRFKQQALPEAKFELEMKYRALRKLEAGYVEDD